MLSWRTGSGAGVGRYTEYKKNYRSKALNGTMEAVFGGEERGQGGESGHSGYGTAGDENANVCWDHTVVVLVPG